jgi:hypothetical protein
MRHVEHPLVRHRVVIEVKHLLAGRTAAAHAVGGPVLLAMLQRVGGRRRFRSSVAGGAGCAAADRGPLVRLARLARMRATLAPERRRYALVRGYGQHV